MSKKKSVVAALVLVALVLIALLCWKSFAPEAVEGDKTITVEVVHAAARVLPSIPTVRPSAQH